MYKIRIFTITKTLVRMLLKGIKNALLNESLTAGI